MTSLGEAVVEVGADTSQFRSQTKAGVQSAVNQANTVTGKLSRTLARVGRNVAFAGAAGLTALVTQAVKTQAAYETTMKTLQVSSGATDKEIAKLSETAKQLGSDTVFSAGEAADAMLELGKSGFDASQILASVPEVMNLAATEGIALDRAAGIVTSSLAQFNLEAKDSALVVNALAGAATASRSSVEGIGESLKLVGSAAKVIGLSVPETTGALAALSQAGLDGSVAGTSLASVFNHLVPQTTKAKDAMEELNLDFTDAHGNFDDIDTIAGKLSDTFKGMDQESRKVNISRIFGNDASSIAAVNALITSGAEGLRKYTKASKDQSAASKLADARMSGTAGAIERLKGSFETAALTLGEKLAPAVTTAADFLDDKLVPAMEIAIDAGGEILDAVAPAFEAVAKALKNAAGDGKGLSSFFSGTLIPLLEVLSNIVAAVVGVLDGLPGPIKDFAFQAGVAALILPKLNSAIQIGTARLTPFIFNMGLASARTQMLQTAAKNAAGIGGILLLTNAFQKTADEGATFGSVLQGAAGGAGIGAMFGPIGALIGAGVGGGLIALTGAFSDSADEAAQARIEMQKTEGFAAAKEGAQQLAESLEGVISKYADVSRAAVEASFMGDDGKLSQDVQDLLDLGVNMDTVVDAALGQKDALAIVEQAWDSYRDSLQASIDQNEAAQSALVQEIGSDGMPTGRMVTPSPDAVEAYKDAVKDAKGELDAFDASADVFDERITKNSEALQFHREAILRAREALGLTRAEYNAFPKELRANLETNFPQTGTQAVRLIKQFKDLQNFKSIRTLIKTDGVELSRKQVQKLATQYKLTPKQIRTIYKLEGIKQAQGESKKGGGQVKRNLEGVDPKGPQLKSWVKGIQTAVNQGARFSQKESRNIVENLEAIKKTKPNLATYVNGVKSSVVKATGEAHKSTAVGTALKQGLLNGAYGAGPALSAIMSSAVRQAIAAARAAAKAHSPSQETMQLGKDMGVGTWMGFEGETQHLVDTATEAMKKTSEEAEKEAEKGGDKAGKAFSKKFKEALKLRAEFAKEVTGSLLDEFNLDDSAFGGVGGLTGDITGLASRFRKFARQIKQLGKAGLPPGLINEVVGLGSERGSEVAAMLLDATKGERNKLSKAFRSMNRSARLVGDVSGVAVKGTNKEIAADVRAILREVRKNKGNGHGNGNGNGNGHGNGSGNGNGHGHGNGHQNDRVVVNNNYYGPQTGQERVRELEWSLRYGARSTRKFKEQLT